MAKLGKLWPEAHSYANLWLKEAPTGAPATKKLAQATKK